MNYALSASAATRALDRSLSWTGARDVVGASSFQPPVNQPRWPGLTSWPLSGPTFAKKRLSRFRLGAAPACWTTGPHRASFQVGIGRWADSTAFRSDAPMSKPAGATCGACEHVVTLSCCGNRVLPTSATICHPLPPPKATKRSKICSDAQVIGRQACNATLITYACGCVRCSDMER